MAAHNSAACSLCVLFLLLSTATLSAAAVPAPGPPLCTMPSPAPEPMHGEDALPHLGSLELNAGYFFGGQDLQFAEDESNTTSYSYVTRSVSLLLLHAFRTSDPAVFHVAATLTLSGGRDREIDYVESHRRRRHHYVGSQSVTFFFEGYYTNGTSSSGELCMAGTGSYSEEENGSTSTKRLRRVELHLRVPNPSSITDPFITGSLKGTGFEAISLVAYAEGDTYHYGKSASCSPQPPSSAAPGRGALQALGAGFSCAHLKERLATSYKLQADGDGAQAQSSSPERRLLISEVQCTADGSVRAYAAFSNDTQMWKALRHQPRPPFTAKGEVVVAEGHWDSARSMLCLRACRVASSGTSSMAVNKDCDMGMSFWFPGVWTIRDRSAVAGKLWNTSKAADGSGVSGVISASSIDVGIHRGNFSDIKYAYNDTMVDQAKKHYLQDPVLSKLKKKLKESFVAPNYTNNDFEFHYYGTNDMVLGGRAYPVTIGSAMVYGDQLAADDSFSRHAVVDVNSQELLTISYDIREQITAAGWVRPKNGSYGIPVEQRRMAAEGVFDPKTGILCMVACREYNSSTTDCQILVTVYLASLDGNAQGHGKGVISSLRNKTTDPLFFEKIDIGLFGMYSEQISESVSRMDFESILLVISTTLPCVFTVLQIFHAKRRREAAAATSVTMLVVLALGYVAPLVVSSDALFLSRRTRYNVPLPFQSYVPYELSQAMLRAPTLIALLLQLRLIQLALSARKADADQNKAESSSSSAAERRALWLCAPLYLIGGALTIIVHVVDSLRAARLEESLTVRIGPEPPTLWEDLVSSAGLAQDAFLLPQVVMNALSPGGSSRIRALSPWFYIGGTVVRAMPHVYDVIRAQGYVPSPRPSYVYASPRYDRYGIAWDVVVPCAAALLAVLVFLQQRVGLAPPLFRSRRRLGEYEMVSPL